MLVEASDFAWTAGSYVAMGVVMMMADLAVSSGGVVAASLFEGLGPAAYIAFANAAPAVAEAGLSISQGGILTGTAVAGGVVLLEEAAPTATKIAAQGAQSSSQDFRHHEHAERATGTVLRWLLSPRLGRRGRYIMARDVIKHYAITVPRPLVVTIRNDLEEWLNETANDKSQNLPPSFGCDYNPRSDGLTERQWVSQIVAEFDRLLQS